MDSQATPDSTTLHREPLTFTGSGWEYFRIWIVNLALSIATVGIYSAWAKVRKMQYFYRNTQLAGAAFNYHGRPAAILRGRIVALALLALYQGSTRFAPALTVVVLPVLGAIFPWLLWRSLRFRLHNTSYRGLRFSFAGNLKGAYSVFLGWPLAAFVTGYLLAPLWHQRLKRYQHDHTRYGQSTFSFRGRIGEFYSVYFKTSAWTLVVLVATLFAFGVAIGMWRGASVRFGPPSDASRQDVMWIGAAFLVVAYLAYMLGVMPFLRSRMTNLIWNRTRLGEFAFESRLSAIRLAAVTFTNLLGIVFTLGLFTPFAQIRMARCRVESLTVLASGPLDDFAAGESIDETATGEEVADFFDIDVAL